MFASVLPVSQVIAQEAAPVQPLSVEALEALVAGIAVYSDPVVEQVLAASQNPAALHEAANKAVPTQEWSASLQGLLAYPGLLQQLDKNLPYTTRLGVASRTQLTDVWRAIDSVRVKMEIAAQEEAVDGSAAVASTGGGTVGYPAAYVPYAGIVAYRLWTHAVVTELAATNTTTTYVGPNGNTVTAATQGASAQYHNGTTDAAIGAASTTVQGPNGNTAYAQGVGAIGTTTVGDTTYAGAAGSGSVTGSGGNTIAGAGQATGSVTQTSNGATFQSQASGSFDSNFGSAGTASHSGQGSVSQNADGSTNFDRSTNGSLNTTNANANYSHTGSGQANGNGTGSYQGSSTVNTAQGSAQTSTTAGNGQASTTVSSANGSNTYTAGDGQVGGSSTAKSSAGQSSTGRPAGLEGNARFSGGGSLQSQLGDRANQRAGTDRPSLEGFGRPDGNLSNRAGQQFSPRNGSSGRSGGRSPGRSGGGGGRRGGGRR